MQKKSLWRQNWVESLATTNFLTLAKSLNFTEPIFSSVKWGNTNYFTRLIGRLDEIMFSHFY